MYLVIINFQLQCLDIKKFVCKKKMNENILLKNDYLQHG